MKTLEIIDGDTLVVRDEDGAELGRGGGGLGVSSCEVILGIFQTRTERSALRPQFETQGRAGA